jgi:hypothetical protein
MILPSCAALTSDPSAAQETPTILEKCPCSHTRALSATSTGARCTFAAADFRVASDFDAMMVARDEIDDISASFSAISRPFLFASGAFAARRRAARRTRETGRRSRKGVPDRTDLRFKYSTKQLFFNFQLHSCCLPPPDSCTPINGRRRQQAVRHKNRA